MTGALRVAVLYPEVLGTYGDTGNALVLERRMAWRGLPVEVVSVPLGSAVPSTCDLYLVGGGEDAAQAVALNGLRRSAGLTDAVGRGAVVLAVCAGLQLLGTSIAGPDGTVAEGLGLLDVTTRRRAVRAVGELVAAPDPALGLPLLTGFENHGGATHLGPDARPLATVVTGVGNGGSPGDGRAFEGAQQGSVLATYLHGPVLARNPALADLLLARALGHPLAPLETPAVEVLRAERLSAARAHHVGAVPSRWRSARRVVARHR
jgi:lipid II isoglutaminyl synthase (glutamine-hydrolysing)